MFQEAGPGTKRPGGGVAEGQQEAAHRRPGHRLGGNCLPQPRDTHVRLQDHCGNMYEVKQVLRNMKNSYFDPCSGHLLITSR